MMKTRSRTVKPVYVPPTRFDRVLDWAVLFMIVLLWVLAICFFIDAPDVIPTRFDLAGHPTEWGSPAIYLLMPMFGSIYGFIMIAVASSSIRQHVDVLKENTVIAESTLKRCCCCWLNIMGQLMSLFLLLVLVYIQHESLRMNISFIVTGIFGYIALMLVVIIYYTIRISRLK